MASAAIKGCEYIRIFVKTFFSRETLSCAKIFSLVKCIWVDHNIQIGTEELKTSKIIFCPGGMSACDNPMKRWPYHNIHTASSQTPAPRAVLSHEVSG